MAELKTGIKNSEVGTTPYQNSRVSMQQMASSVDFQEFSGGRFTIFGARKT